MNVSHKKIIYDQWLAKILQRDTYRLVADEDLIQKASDETSSECQLLRELQSRPIFMYAKIPTTCLCAVNFLDRLGFSLVDTNVVFEKEIEQAHRFADNCVVRLSTPKDKSQVMELSKNGFAYSRFHLDSMISAPVANLIKAQWAGNYFAGAARGHKMVVALVDEAIVGFLLLVRGDDDLIINLIAVDEMQRRKGIASDMIAYAEIQSSGYSRTVVGTQVANIASIRFYEKNGFRLCASNYVFHFHNLSEVGK